MSLEIAINNLLKMASQEICLLTVILIIELIQVILLAILIWKNLISK